MITDSKTGFEFESGQKLLEISMFWNSNFFWIFVRKINFVLWDRNKSEYSISWKSKSSSCQCCSETSGCLPEPITENIVQNLIEIDDYLLYCQNVNGSCTILDKNDLATSNPVLTQSELVSQIPENPAMVSILEISDSENVLHKVLYAGRVRINQLLLAGGLFEDHEFWICYNMGHFGS